MSKKPTYEELEQRIQALEKAESEFKQAEAALRESEARYRLHFENVSDIIYTVDPEFKLLDISPSVERVLGYKPKELIGRPFQDLNVLASEYMEQAFSDSTRVLKGEVITSTVYQFIARDGTKKWGEVSGSPLIRDNQVVAIISVARDITERKRAESALKDEATWRRILIGESRDGIVVLDQNGKVREANRRYAEMIGYSMEEVIQLHVWDWETQWTREQLLEMIKTVDEAGDHFETRHRRKDGTFYDVEISTNGSVVGGQKLVLCVCRDVTERKRVEKALRNTRDYLDKLFNYANAPIIVWDTAGKITRFNHAFERMTGLSADEVIGQEPSILFPESSRDESLGKIQNILRDEYWESVEIPILRKDGDVRTALWNSANIYDEDGVMVIATIAQGQDITERKMAEKEKEKLEAELRQAQKMEAIGTLAGGIAHDFNNILAIILGNTELALEDVPVWNPAQHRLKEVRTACLRAKDLVKQILYFARKSQLEIKPVEIGPMVKETVKLIRASIPTTIEIRQDISAESIVVTGDPIQLHQVLMNLCVNAAQAMGEAEGILTVSVTNIDLDQDAVKEYGEPPPGGYVKITISDTGCGIEPDIRDRIFDPYFTTKGLREGTGMGLAAALGIVKSCGGAISVQSEAGKGATFQVVLPRSDGQVTTATEIFQDAPTGNERILFIDDEPAIANLGKQMLERLGYEVVARTSSIEAMELFKAQPDGFDLVITDMTMPHMTGYELAKKLMEVRADIPVILCTGYSPKISEEKAKDRGIRAFAMKPLVKKDLGNTVRKVLDEKPQ